MSTVTENYVIRIFRQHGLALSGETVNALSGKKTQFRNVDELLATLKIEKPPVKKIHKKLRENNDPGKRYEI